MTQLNSGPRWLRYAGVAAIAAAFGLLGSSTPAAALVGGQTAAPGAHPFVVTVSTAEQTCSGVLVHAQWVMTLRSCFGTVPGMVQAPPTATMVIVGQPNTGTRVAVTEISPHRSLNVVLAKMASPVSGVTPVKFGAAPTAGEVLQAVGYGRTATEWVPANLHTAAVQAGGITGYGFTIAAAGGGVTLCQGDAGGPTLRVAGSVVELVGIHEGAGQAGCLDSTTTDRSAADIRADILDPWLKQHIITPVLNDPNYVNLARTATIKDWSTGVTAPGLKDGVRGKLGWSKSAGAATIDVVFPEVRTFNRIDFHPRTDVAAAQNNSPTSIRIQILPPPRLMAVEPMACVECPDPTPVDPNTTIAERGNIARSASVQQFPVGIRSTQTIRIELSGVTKIDLSEIEIFNMHPSVGFSPYQVPASIVEMRDYPGAVAILAERGIKLFKGDGHITLADCGSATGLVQLYSRALTPSLVCFKVTGPVGYLKLEIPEVYNIKGDDHAIKATLTTDGTVSSVDIARNAWTPVGEGSSNGSSTLLVLTAS